MKTSQSGINLIRQIRTGILQYLIEKVQCTCVVRNIASAGGSQTERLYLMRKSCEDAKSQIGAFSSLDNAKKACAAGYNVYDWNGKAVYSVFAGAKTGEHTGKGVFTITEVKLGKGSTAGWSKLKSGAGWISLDYATRLE